ncbi:MAG: crystallin [Chthonomonadales bacterium]|nr:crystallin [Chthonomonadales bacterium]
MPRGREIGALMTDEEKVRYSLAWSALEGLSVGDAFGEGFFTDPESIEEMIATRSVPEPIWRYTDDTQMTLSIVSVLRQHGMIEQDLLAAGFVERYEYARGYGPSMHRLLAAMREGTAWQEVASAQFAGQGSFGNGAAMRAAPIGAYFADDLEKVVEQTILASVVTHTHPEAIAGAIAVAVAAALATRLHGDKQNISGADFLAAVAQSVPESQVKARLIRARGMLDASVGFAVTVLGNGMQLSAQDTVPFALWCVCQHLFDYEESLWLAVSALGDRDTICAIVGGIVALSAGADSIPAGWRAAREPLPTP